MSDNRASSPDAEENVTRAIAERRDSDVPSSVPRAATIETEQAEDSQSEVGAGSDAERPKGPLARTPRAEVRERILTERMRRAAVHRFPLISDEVVETLPPPEPLAGPLVVGTLATLTAKPGTGKTFVGLDLALSVASGRKWLDAFPVRRGTVVYVVAEGGGGVGLRVRAWKRARAAKGHAGVYFLMRAVNLLDQQEVSMFLLSLRALPERPVLIVFDTLARCMVG